jgi:transcriptional regulator with XRE-family HTH domain
VVKREVKANVVEQLREAIVESKMPLNRLSKVSGVHRSQLSRFLRCERDISLAAAAAVCQALGYELTKITPPAPKRKGNSES